VTLVDRLMNRGDELWSRCVAQGLGNFFFPLFFLTNIFRPGFFGFAVQKLLNIFCAYHSLVNRYQADAPIYASIGFDPGGHGMVRVVSRASMRTRTDAAKSPSGNVSTLSK
jgi:hypothetical protein